MSSEDIVSGVPQGAPVADMADPVTSLIAHGDDNLVLAQRLGEWISRAPDLEEDIAIGNVALDHLGVARALYTHAARLEGRGRGEDDIAMGRNERRFRNVLLVEQPNGDFAQTMVRQLLFDAYQLQIWADLAGSDDDELAGIAARAHKEAKYHFRHSSGWVIRLGDGTEESHLRTQRALDALWRFTGELFEGDTARYRSAWEAMIAGVIAEATVELPSDPYQRSGGRQGFHTEHLGPLLAEMQWMHHAYPGMEW